MRQGDGSDLLGQGDPRSADIGILYIEPEDSRQEILTAITTEDAQGRKQIAIVLPDQGKAFRQPVEFDGLKNMRRNLKAHLIFIARSGPGPAEFARQRRFVVYSSLETFKTALLSERASLNPRAKGTPSEEKKPGVLGRSRASRGRQPAPAPLSPIPPTPRITPAVSVQPAIPAPPPRVTPQASGADAQAVPPLPPVVPILPPAAIEDIETQTIDLEKPGSAPAPSGEKGALAASSLDDNEDLAPPMAPRPPAGGAGSGGPARSGRTGSLPRSGPTPLMLGQQTTPPRSGGSGKVPAASASGSQTRSGTSKPLAAPGRSSKPLAPAQGSPGAPAARKQSEGKSGSTGKIPVVIPVGVAPGGSAPVGGAAASPASAATPAVVAATGTSGGPGAGQRSVGLTPLPPPASQRRRRGRGRRRLLLLLLLLLSLVLIGVLLLNALSGPGGLAALGHLTATVQITPQSQIVQNNYLISAVTTIPDVAKRQIGARVLTAQSETQHKTANATGSIPAKQATGTLVFSSSTGNDITLGTTVLTANNGAQIQFNGPVVVPALSSTTVKAFAVHSGAQGNIPAKAIFGSCCFAGIGAQNPSAFTGGQDQQNDVIIQQPDIDGAARPLVSQLTQSTQTALKQQVRSGEQVVDGSFKCQPTTSADHKAGDLAKTVTVSVSVKCSEEVFNLAAAQQMASGFLRTSPPNNVDLTGYKLVGSIVTTLISATVVSGENQVSVNIQAAGKWIFQFSDQLQQQIKQKLVSQSKTNAQRLLKQYMGVFSAIVTISSGSTMPSDVNDITLNIVSLAGLQPGTPTGVPTLPVSSPPATSGPGANPNATSTPDLGGS